MLQPRRFSNGSLLRRDMKRLALYMFHDGAGVARRYVLHALQAIRPHVDRIVVVSNGPLQAASRTALQQVVEVVHERANVGFDVGAYREGLIEVIGWQNLAEYDELLLLNYTFYAPIFSFAEAFAKLAAADVDFWGLTAFKGPAQVGERLIPYHLQSHFIAVRKRLFESAAFREYWQSMPAIESYRDSIDRHEIRFTPHFEALGFRHAVYCDPAPSKSLNAAIESPDDLLEQRCPILKRRPFFSDPAENEQRQLDLRETLSRVAAESTFDVSLIWDDIARVTAPRVLYANLSMLEVLPAAVAASTTLRPAVFVHVDHGAPLAAAFPFIARLQGPFDVHVTVTEQADIEPVSAALRAGCQERASLATVRVTAEASALAALVATQGDLLRDGGYDIGCRLCLSAEALREHQAFVSLLDNPSQVNAWFRDQSQLGLVMPPSITGTDIADGSWATDKVSVAAMLRSRNIAVPLDEDAPMTPRSSMFWFRPAALSALGPRVADERGELFEHLLVYAAQQQGFFARAAMTVGQVAQSHTMLEYRLLQAQTALPSVLTTLERLADEKLGSKLGRAMLKRSIGLARAGLSAWRGRKP